MVRKCRCRKFSVGAELIREGLEDDHTYVLAAGLLKVTQKGQAARRGEPGRIAAEMVYARRRMAPRSATVTAVEISWVLCLRIQDIDGFSDPCRAKFSEAFLSVIADRLSMLGGRLVSLMHEERKSRLGFVVPAKARPSHAAVPSNSRNPGGGWLDHAARELSDFFGPPRAPLLFFPFAAVSMSFDAYTAMARKRFARMGYEVIGAHRARSSRGTAGFLAGGGNTFRLLDECSGAAGSP